MDLSRIGLHIYEIRNQFTYIEGNVGILNQALEKGNNAGAFMALQSIFISASQVSRMLWAPRKVGKARSDELRKFLGIPDEHPLNNKDLQTLFDFSDEKTEEWIKNSKGKYILADYIGDLAASEHKDVLIEHILRSFDLKSKIYIYRGVGFQMDNVMNAMRGISDAVNKAHAHLFPNHWKDPDQKPKKTSKNKETEEKSNTKKKPAAKAKSKKKD